MAGQDYIDVLIRRELYDGIRDQDGWETLEMTVRADHPAYANMILERLHKTQKGGG